MRTTHTVQPAPAASLYEIPRHRIEAARHQAANRATVALLTGRARLARRWMQIMVDCDAEANRVATLRRSA